MGPMCGWMLSSSAAVRCMDQHRSSATNQQARSAANPSQPPASSLTSICRSHHFCIAASSADRPSLHGMDLMQST